MDTADEKTKPFNWVKFQQNMGYNDQEMAKFTSCWRSAYRSRATS